MWVEGEGGGSDILEGVTEPTGPVDHSYLSLLVSHAPTTIKAFLVRHRVTG